MTIALINNATQARLFGPKVAISRAAPFARQTPVAYGLNPVYRLRRA